MFCELTLPSSSTAKKRRTLPLVLAASLFASGCLSSKYQLAQSGTPPAVALDLVAAAPSLSVQLHSVIVHHGPGSWKREAYWDEYVVTFTNRCDTPLVVDSAALIDFQGASSAPGTDPWTLEAESKTWWQKAKSSQTGNLLALGAGAVGLSATLVTAAIVASGGILAPATAASTALVTAAGATLVAAPVYAVSIVVINSKNKQKVADEFQRRRLALPQTIAPGQSVQGSLFFRISPAPQQLVIRSHTDSGARELCLELTPLRGMHLKTPAAPATTTLPTRTLNVSSDDTPMLPSLATTSTLPRTP